MKGAEILVSKARTRRIAERIREELSEMLLLEVADPRLEGVSITDVTVDRELAYADIYVSALEGAQRSKDIMIAFGNAHGYLRKELALRVDLRVFPRLRFHWDPTFERAERIEKLLSELHQSEGSTEEKE